MDIQAINLPKLLLMPPAPPIKGGEIKYTSQKCEMQEFPLPPGERLGEGDVYLILSFTIVKRRKVFGYADAYSTSSYRICRREKAPLSFSYTVSV